MKNRVLESLQCILIKILCYIALMLSTASAANAETHTISLAQGEILEFVTLTVNEGPSASIKQAEYSAKVGGLLSSSNAEAFYFKIEDSVGIEETPDGFSIYHFPGQAALLSFLQKAMPLISSQSQQPFDLKPLLLNIRKPKTLNFNTEQFYSVTFLWLNEPEKDGIDNISGQFTDGFTRMGASSVQIVDARDIYMQQGDTPPHLVAFTEWKDENHWKYLKATENLGELKADVDSVIVDTHHFKLEKGFKVAGTGGK